MATFFSLNDGSLSAASTYGYSLSSYEQIDGVNQYTSDQYAIMEPSDGSSISAVALNLYSRSLNPTGYLNVNGGKLLNPSILLDSSINNYTLQNTGGIINYNLTPNMTGGWSGKFDGSANYVSVTDNFDKFAFDSSDFTIECWYYPTGSKTWPTALGIGNHNSSSSGIAFFLQHNGTLKPSCYGNNNTNYQPTNVADITLNSWNHIVWQRKDNNLKIFVNGVRSDAKACPVNVVTPTVVSIGFPRAYTSSNIAYAANGYISNLKVTNATALYDENQNFTPSLSFGTSVFTSLYTFKSYQSYLNDASNNNVSLTATTGFEIANLSPKIFKSDIKYFPYLYGGSARFDGATQYIKTTMQSINSSDDFTIECWFYAEDFSPNTVGVILNTDDATDNNRYLRYTYYGDTKNVEIVFNSISYNIGKAAYNTWNHISVTRESSTLKLFLNGKLINTILNNTETIPAQNLAIGANLGRFSFMFTPFKGYITNVRFVKGSALYTTDFIPSSASSQNVTGTQLLLNFDRIGKVPIVSQSYPISSFAYYNGTSNYFSPDIQNWEILKLPNILSAASYDNITLDITTTNSNQLSLVGASGYYYENTGLNPLTLMSGVPLNYSTSNFNDIPTNTISFDGGGGLSAASSSGFNFGSGDFTIELWYNTSTVRTGIYAPFVTNEGFTDGGVRFDPDRFLFGFRQATTGGGGAPNGTWNVGLFYFDGSVDSVNRIMLDTNVTADGLWHHAALVRRSNVWTIYIDGIDKASITIARTVKSNNNFFIGRRGPYPTGYYTGYIASLRIIKGKALYTENFTPPSQLDLLTRTPETVLILGSRSNYNKCFISNNSYTPTSNNDIIHVGAVLDGSNVEPKTVTVDTLTAKSIFVHNRGTLNFPLTSSKTLTITGSAGLRVTSNGTLNVGTSSSNIPNNLTHTIILSNTRIDVDNAGTLNVYGAPKVVSTYLTIDSLSGSNSFVTTDSVSSTWNTGDKLLFTPNLTAKNSFDVLTLNTFTAGNQFTTTASSSSTHLGVSSLPYVPAVTNLTRNVKIRGLDSSNRATIRTIDDSKVFLSNLQISNFGVNTTNKNGLIYGGTSNGSLILSGVVFDNDYTTGVGNIVRLTDRNLQNLTLANNVFYNTNSDGISFASVSSNNVNITNNLILSSAGNGINLQSVNGSMDIRDNITVSTGSHGLYLLNNTFSAKSPEFYSTNYNSGARGLSLESNISGISSLKGNYINSIQEGAYINAATFKLSSTSIKDVVASNNTLDGVRVVGNNTNYLTPLSLKINGLTASNNLDTGLEVYNITGSLSNIYVSNNTKTNIKSSIGNGDIIIDSLSSTLDAIIPYSKPLTTTTSYPTISSANPSNISSEGSFLVNGNSYVIDDNDGELMFATNDFTIEFFVYLTNSSSNGFIINKGKTDFGTPNYSWHIYSTNGSNLNININNDSNGLVIKNGITKNQWHHIAVTRYSGNITTFFDGVSTSSIYIPTINTSINPIKVCGDSSFPINGWYFSNIRIINGTSMYNTNNFTVPSTPLSTTSDTRALIQYPYDNTYKKVYNNENVKILSATNYGKTIIKNSLINSYGNLPSQIRGSSKGLTLSANILEDFRMENSTISAYTPFAITSNRPKIEGSYHFHNCNSSSYKLSSIALEKYQSDVFLDSGFAVMREDGLSGRHYKQLVAGRISYDTTELHTMDDVASEKLEPMSSTIKLRSSSRQIPMNAGDTLNVTVYMKKSQNYTGSAPRLMLKDNQQLGFDETVLHTSILANDTWELMTGSIPAALANGVAEVYVDCSGSVGCGSINIDDWDFS